ncbi:MAG: hypothetical protein WCI61_10965 [Chloroflexota bacterium]
MTRSVGLMYAVSGLVTAASLLAMTAATVGLGGARPDGVEARQGGAVESVATVVAPAPAPATDTPAPRAAAPAAPSQVGLATVRTEGIPPAPTALAAGTAAPTVAVRRAHDDDDEHEGREHESREYERTSRTRRETH